MKLHTDTKLLQQTILAASQSTGINPIFIEKDYWISLLLSRLAKSKYKSQTVFKGGTSLSKGYGLINRFSEDVDIAIIEQKEKSGNVIKTIIRTVEKEMIEGLQEIVVENVTSKGSRYRKSVFEYESNIPQNPSNRLMLEVNSFANPYPFQEMSVKSLIYDFLITSENKKFIDDFELLPFRVNVLSKEQTLIEKLVSLIRFSFDENITTALASKIRHFYDLYFLFYDGECNEFIKSQDFKSRFNEILEHDKVLFDLPKAWSTRELNDSPLIAGFDKLWNELKGTYTQELSALAFSPIPSEKDIGVTFKKLIKFIL